VPSSIRQELKADKELRQSFEDVGNMLTTSKIVRGKYAGLPATPAYGEPIKMG